jgi:hypothetical protein
LHVLHINLNTNYDDTINTCKALDTTIAIFGSNPSVGWHYTSPSGIKPDLHHALLGKVMDGGCAFVGDVICDSSAGFGISGNLVGNFVSMDNAVVWDISVVSCSEMMVESK